MKYSFVLFLAFTSICSADAIPTVSIAEKGDLVFSDDFQRTDLGDWIELIPTFEVSGGVLNGKQTKDDHGAVGRIHRPMKDVVIDFRFKLNGSTGFNAVFDDKNHRGSHAGHICRVAFAPKQIRLGDDKEGIMRNDIFAMRRDPATKADADKLLVGRGSIHNFVIEQDVWYQVSIEILDDQMRVSVDNKPIGYLRSPGISHDTKASFHFTVSGPGVLFDDVRIWHAH